MNLEEMSKLKHLINQFEGQLHRVNQEKEKSEISLKEAMEKISCLKDQHPLELQAKHHRHQID
jgi:phage shock protein A